MDIPDIREAKMLDDCLIHIFFENGEQKIFDMKPYLKYEVFAKLECKEELEKYKIIDGTIEWECGADLSQDTFYLESKEVVQKRAIV